MTSVRSAEQALLAPAAAVLDAALSELGVGGDPTTARLVMLEEVAALCGTWDPEAYRRRVVGWPGRLPTGLRPWAEKVHAALAELPIPAPLAVASLAQAEVTISQRRRSGAYYTDSRLAADLARASVPLVRTNGPWLDPACGTGMLLTAAVLELPPGRARDTVITQRLCGADLSGPALRGALLSVAAATGNLDAVVAFRRRLFRHDSLRSTPTWRTIAPSGAALVIGNPPWEKLRTTRHEVLGATGATRHYGQRYDSLVDVSVERRRLVAYLHAAAGERRLQGGGEHDLYKLFVELGLDLVADGGVLALLVPAGLIRARGTEALRRQLLTRTSELHIGVMENRRRYFPIDSRFKFLTVVARFGPGPRRPVELRVAGRTGELPTRPVAIDRPSLAAVRPDLTVPEVRTSDEWELFRKLACAGPLLGDPIGPWRPRYRREIDMTNDAGQFVRGRSSDALPVIEGRHVHQFRHRAKAYRGGEGRAARWDPLPVAGARLVTQWYIPAAALRPGSRHRTAASRIGFCDITGQSNERSLLAARIPAGVVCGNKVPTLMFADGGAEREDLFLALANSLPVDWLLRRLLTTTVNFFILDSLPLPPVTPTDGAGRELIALARRLSSAEGDTAANQWRIGQWRARIDAIVAELWALSADELALILTDFPLLDRGQPALPDEPRSTITADCVLAAAAGEGPGPHAGRVEAARRCGAFPYVPSELTGTQAKVRTSSSTATASAPVASRPLPGPGRRRAAT